MKLRYMNFLIYQTNFPKYSREIKPVQRNWTFLSGSSEKLYQTNMMF